MSIDLELEPEDKAAAWRALLRAGWSTPTCSASRPGEWGGSPRRLAIRSACSWSTSCASTPARYAYASWFPSSTSPNLPVSHHLKVLRDAGIVGSERPGLWAYYYVEDRGPRGVRPMAELSAAGEDAPDHDIRLLRRRAADRVLRALREGRVLRAGVFDLRLLGRRMQANRRFAMPSAPATAPPPRASTMRRAVSPAAARGPASPMSRPEFSARAYTTESEHGRAPGYGDDGVARVWKPDRRRRAGRRGDRPRPRLGWRHRRLALG